MNTGYGVLESASRTLLQLDELFVEAYGSDLTPNMLFINENLLNNLKEAFPYLVKGGKLLYNNKMFDVVVVKDDGDTLGVGYGYFIKGYR